MIRYTPYPGCSVWRRELAYVGDTLFAEIHEVIDGPGHEVLIYHPALVLDGDVSIATRIQKLDTPEECRRLVERLYSYFQGIN